MLGACAFTWPILFLGCWKQSSKIWSTGILRTLYIYTQIYPENYIRVCVYTYTYYMFFNQPTTGYNEAKHGFDMIWVPKTCLPYALKDGRACFTMLLTIYSS